MNQLKQFQTILKQDSYVLNESVKLLGTEDIERYSKVNEHVSKLQYQKVEESIENLKQTLFKNDLTKFQKIENDIKKIRKLHSEISVVLNANFDKIKTIKKQKLKVPEKIKDYKFPLQKFLNWKEFFDKIKDEQIPIIIGKHNDEIKISDLIKMPHLLVAGETGSGKSVFLNSLITTILYTQHPDNCKLVLVDPKRIEFSLYKKIPHLWRHVVTDTGETGKLLDDLVEEMEQRFKDLEEFDVRSLDAYNKKSKNKKPYIVVVIDEMADLMLTTSGSLKERILRLVQLSRAVGIHLVMATQRPVVKFIDGTIKCNMPTRISFKVATAQDSRVILDTKGAEQLNGNGDMLMLERGKLARYQANYIDEEQIKKIVEFITKG